MYNLKTPHTNYKVVGDIINILNGKYGKEAPLTVTWGKLHKHLVIKIDFSSEGKVIIQMYDYVKKILKEAKEYTALTDPPPAS